MESFPGLAEHREVVRSARCTRTRSLVLKQGSRQLGLRAIELRYTSGRLIRARRGQVLARAMDAPRSDGSGGTSGESADSGAPGRPAAVEGVAYWARGVPIVEAAPGAVLDDAMESTLVLELDAEGLVTRCSGGSAEIVTGFTATDLLGRHLSVLYDDAAVADFQAERDLVAAIASDGLAEMAWRTRADGSRFWSSTTIRPRYGDQGKVAGFTVMLRAEPDGWGPEASSDFADGHHGDRGDMEIVNDVVNELFKIGLILEGVRNLTGQAEARARLDDAVAKLDDTIRLIRREVWRQR